MTTFNPLTQEEIYHIYIMHKKKVTLEEGNGCQMAAMTIAGIQQRLMEVMGEFTKPFHVIKAANMTQNATTTPNRRVFEIQRRRHFLALLHEVGSVTQ
ncbi:MAG: hypothetical protein CVV13_04180 [Gammaproteobacteria bacterium HGW-Gammaproteobacteria-3]|nr:MAG: hypothetical protein CVV13_04180 [Gammaproteobacteria bacterium HGW-Gammaproteobacteria-3]